MHWARPVDLDEASVPLWMESGGGIDSQHPGGANVAFADGAVRFLRFDTDTESQVRDQVTPRGGEIVSSTNR